MAGDRKPRRTGAPKIAPGAVVADKYVVDAVLGTGAMGVVVSATHKLIGQRVAIKLIKAEYVDSEDALARFKREARAMVAVESENVVRVLDYGTLPDEGPYLVMEYLTGRDLQQELRARGRLPLAEAAEIVVQACEGLAAAHARGIIHRDVKPANLFLTRRGNGKRLVKIVDFGISKTPKASEEDLTLTRGSIGSPHYMSPEQLRSARTVDARSDVWSLGVTLYRALTGELPFGGESVASLLAAVVSEEPRRLRDAQPELPVEVESIVSRCLQKNAEDRFAGMQELADALAPFAMPDAERAARVSSGKMQAVASPSPSPSPAAAALHESTAKAHVAPVAPPARRPRAPIEWGPRAVLAAAIAVPLVLVSLVLRFAPAQSGAGPAAKSTGATPSQVIAITDLPLPKTANAAAAAAYLAALQAVRDASLAEASNGFDRAAALDPTMAAAQLRSAVYGDWLIGSETRKHARAALALRASLSDDDRALLGAVEPLYLPPQPDTDEARRRVDRLVAARPKDTEILFLSGLLFLNRRSRAENRVIADRLVALDPRFAAAPWLRALMDELEWDPAAVGRDVDQCLAISPSAASCLRVRATVEDVQGSCAALEDDARRMVAMEEGSYRAYEFLSLALLARGRPADSVREALARKWRATPEVAREKVRTLDEARLAILRGDFASASKDATALDGLARAAGSASDLAAAALLEIDLDEELGDVAGAAQVADGYLRGASGSAPGDTIDDDPRPRLYAAAARGGLRSPEERDRVLDEWRAFWDQQIRPHERPRVWLEGFAAPAATRQEAEAALALLPAYAPVPPIVIGGMTTPVLAKVHVLAGRYAEALAELQLVTKSCDALADPIAFVRAHLELGETLEATGDTAGACAAYGVVLEHWGGGSGGGSSGGGAKTHPPTPLASSVTASLAAARSKALACPPR